MTLTLRRAAAPLGLFAGVALAMALIDYGVVRFTMHQLASFTRGGLPRLDHGAAFAVRLATLLAGLALLALAIAAGRRAGSHRFLGGRALTVVLLCAAGFAAGYLGLFASNAALTMDRFRVSVIAPVIWAAGMALVVWAYAVMRRRGLRYAGVYAVAATLVVHAAVLSAPVMLGNSLRFRVDETVRVSVGGYWDDLTSLPFYANKFGLTSMLDVRGWLMILAAGFCLGLVAVATPRASARTAGEPVPV